MLKHFLILSGDIPAMITLSMKTISDDSDDDCAMNESDATSNGRGDDDVETDYDEPAVLPNQEHQAQREQISIHFIFFRRNFFFLFEGRCSK